MQAGANFMGNPNGHVKPLQQKCFFLPFGKSHFFQNLLKVTSLCKSQFLPVVSLPWKITSWDSCGKFLWTTVNHGIIMLWTWYEPSTNFKKSPFFLVKSSIFWSWKVESPIKILHFYRSRGGLVCRLRGLLYPRSPWECHGPRPRFVFSKLWGYIYTIYIYNSI